MERLEPGHLEYLYERMQKSGSAAGTAHHAHRTIRVALGEAVRRGHVTKNVAAIANAPSPDEEETEPYTIEEIQSLLFGGVEAPQQHARRVIALTLGLRQGEALGLMWEDVYLDAGYVRIRKNRLRAVRAWVRRQLRPETWLPPERRQIRREFKKTEPYETDVCMTRVMQTAPCCSCSGSRMLGWEPGGSARMRARYTHVTGPMLKNVVHQVGEALWGPAPEAGEDSGAGSNEEPSDLN
ncbi:integrase [Streptomyces sp. L-9-10]|uniref:tyrosine-type recombinase/integrase n=1 Tax=Streptomyces sp. L-9-10 TaxID=1478131 RepID=UPI0010E2FA78|nr:hypothetical protein [Streptomyces sp. L-9-10]RYJ30535.1 integrase [Streptomyces sp. L-9-10]